MAEVHRDQLLQAVLGDQAKILQRPDLIPRKVEAPQFLQSAQITGGNVSEPVLAQVQGLQLGQMIKSPGLDNQWNITFGAELQFLETFQSMKHSMREISDDTVLNAELLQPAET